MISAKAWSHTATCAALLVPAVFGSERLRLPASLRRREPQDHVAVAVARNLGDGGTSRPSDGRAISRLRRPAPVPARRRQSREARSRRGLRRCLRDRYLDHLPYVGAGRAGRQPSLTLRALRRPPCPDRRRLPMPRPPYHARSLHRGCRLPEPAG
jgi:hypothetical protein